MNLRALGNHVIIERDPVSNVSEGGVVLPVAKVEHKGLEYGNVVAVGPEVKDSRLGGVVRHRILFVAKKAVPIKTDDKTDLVCVHEDDIVALVD